MALAAGLLVTVAAVAGCDDESTGDDGGEREISAAGDPTASETPRDRTDAPSTAPTSPPDDRGKTPAGRDRRDGTRPNGDRPDADPGDRTGRPNPQGVQPRFGAVYHGMWDMTWPDRAELLDKLVATGATWVRVGLPWAMVQPDRPTAGNSGWSLQWGVPKADRVIAQAVRRGLTVSITFLNTPEWANGGVGSKGLPSDPSTYTRAIEWLAHRYQNQVSSWEIWNEPNNPNHLAGGSVADYVRLLCAAYPAVHSGDPSTKVVFGGTSGVDWEFIDAAYELGAKDCFDVLAVHPYNSDVSPVPQARSDHRWWWRNIELVRDVMRRHRDLATPVWFTEFGWSTHPNPPGTPSYELGVTHAQQATYAVQLLRITQRAYPYVERVAWYAARDETNSTVENNNFGLFRLDLSPKPIVATLRDFLASR